MVTDGPLDAAACSRLARRAGLGLARTGSTASHGSGEIFLALATGLRAPRGSHPPPDVAQLTGRELDPFFAAVVEATEEAVLNSLLAAPTVTGRDGNTSRGLPAARVAQLLTEAGRIDPSPAAAVGTPRRARTPAARSDRTLSDLGEFARPMSRSTLQDLAPMPPATRFLWITAPPAEDLVVAARI